MKLYDYLQLTKVDTEITITDKDYDTETYVYNSEPSDKWDKLIIELEKMIEVKEIIENGVVVVNYEKLIAPKIKELRNADIFINDGIIDIICTMDDIINGNVSEGFVEKFIKALK